MTTLAEIEAAIARLPPPQVDELARWLNAFQSQASGVPRIDDWLRTARGRARSGETTESILEATRGES